MHRLWVWMCVALLAAGVVSAQAQTADDAVFSEQVAAGVLNQVRDALEGHSASGMLATFDAAKMEDYSAFADQVQAFFERYETFRISYRIVQSMTEGARGIVLVDIEMEATPRTAPPIRKSAQMRFELERGAKGWKIVEVRPREFFS